MILHAGLAALRLGGVWRGALITGESGSGKSDLALRLLDAGWRLISDDRTLVWVSDGRLFGRAPKALAGQLEVREVGVSARPALPLAEVALFVRCETPSIRLERMPEPQAEVVRDVQIPLLRLHATHASAPLKLALSLCALDSLRAQA